MTFKPHLCPEIPAFSGAAHHLSRCPELCKHPERNSRFTVPGPHRTTRSDKETRTPPRASSLPTIIYRSSSYLIGEREQYENLLFPLVVSRCHTHAHVQTTATAFYTVLSQSKAGYLFGTGLLLFCLGGNFAMFPALTSKARSAAVKSCSRVVLTVGFGNVGRAVGLV